MGILIFNIILFVVSSLLIFSGFKNFELFLTLPVGLEILIGIGIVTPIMILYDSIKVFVILGSLLSQEGKDEDNL